LLDGVLRVERSESEAGERSIAIPPLLLAALSERYKTSPYKADDQFVFCHPETGYPYNADTFATALRAALKAAGLAADL
jgi:hypothetical protein